MSHIRHLYNDRLLTQQEMLAFLSSVFGIVENVAEYPPMTTNDADLYLQHGRHFRGAAHHALLPVDRFGSVFEAARHLSYNGPVGGLQYFQGFLLHDGFVQAHAWCVSAMGRVYDVLPLSGGLKNQDRYFGIGFASIPRFDYAIMKADANVFLADLRRFLVQDFERT